MTWESDCRQMNLEQGGVQNLSMAPGYNVVEDTLRRGSRVRKRTEYEYKTENDHLHDSDDYNSVASNDQDDSDEDYNPQDDADFVDDDENEEDYSETGKEGDDDGKEDKNEKKDDDENEEDHSETGKEGDDDDKEDKNDKKEDDERKEDGSDKVKKGDDEDKEDKNDKKEDDGCGEDDGGYRGRHHPWMDSEHYKYIEGKHTFKGHEVQVKVPVRNGRKHYTTCLNVCEVKDWTARRLQEMVSRKLRDLQYGTHLETEEDSKIPKCHFGLFALDHLQHQPDMPNKSSAREGGPKLVLQVAPNFDVACLAK